MDALAEHFDLPLGDDEELAAIFAFDDQLVAERDFFGLEAAWPCGAMIASGSFENSGTLRSDFGGNDARAVGDVDADPLGLASVRPSCG